MKIEEYKELNKGALVASFNVIVPEWGLTIRNCTLFEKGHQSWIGYPSRAYDDPETGKKKYFNYLHFEEEVKSRFESAIKGELKKFRGAVQQDSQLFENEEIPF